MPFTIGTKKIVPPPAQIKKQKSAEEKAKKEKQAILYKRRKESEALLFGSELFEPAMKREKEVIIHFPEICTNEEIYISKCGRFGYRRAISGFYFDLFYFIDAVLEFDATLVIIPSDTIWLFDNLTPQELEDLACKLKRVEYAAEKEEEKKKLLEAIREEERLRQEELDKADAEFLAEQEQEKEAEQLSFETAMIPETNIEITTVTNHKEGVTEVVSSRIVEPKETKPAFKPLTFRKINKL